MEKGKNKIEIVNDVLLYHRLYIYLSIPQFGEMKFLLKIKLQIRSIKIVHISHIPSLTYHKSLLSPDYASYSINNISFLKVVSNFICVITVAIYQIYLLK